jgi:hypothetical protein
VGLEFEFSFVVEAQSAQGIGKMSSGGRFALTAADE